MIGNQAKIMSNEISVPASSFINLTSINSSGKGRGRDHWRCVDNLQSCFKSRLTTVLQVLHDVIRNPDVRIRMIRMCACDLPTAISNVLSDWPCED